MGIFSNLFRRGVNSADSAYNASEDIINAARNSEFGSDLEQNIKSVFNKGEQRYNYTQPIYDDAGIYTGDFESTIIHNPLRDAQVMQNIGDVIKKETDLVANEYYKSINKIIDEQGIDDHSLKLLGKFNNEIGASYDQFLDILNPDMIQKRLEFEADLTNLLSKRGIDFKDDINRAINYRMGNSLEDGYMDASFGNLYQNYYKNGGKFVNSKFLDDDDILELANKVSIREVKTVPKAKEIIQDEFDDYFMAKMFDNLPNDFKQDFIKNSDKLKDVMNMRKEVDTLSKENRHLFKNNDYDIGYSKPIYASDRSFIIKPLEDAMNEVKRYGDKSFINTLYTKTASLFGKKNDDLVRFENSFKIGNKQFGVLSYKKDPRVRRVQGAYTRNSDKMKGGEFDLRANNFSLNQKNLDELYSRGMFPTTVISKSGKEIPFKLVARPHIKEEIYRIDRNALFYDGMVNAGVDFDLRYLISPNTYNDLVNYFAKDPSFNPADLKKLKHSVEVAVLNSIDYKRSLFDYYDVFDAELLSKIRNDVLTSLDVTKRHSFNLNKTSAEVNSMYDNTYSFDKFKKTQEGLKDFSNEYNQKYSISPGFKDDEYIIGKVNMPISNKARVENLGRVDDFSISLAHTLSNIVKHNSISNEFEVHLKNMAIEHEDAFRGWLQNNTEKMKKGLEPDVESLPFVIYVKNDKEALELKELGMEKYIVPVFDKNDLTGKGIFVNKLYARNLLGMTKMRVTGEAEDFLGMVDNLFQDLVNVARANVSIKNPAVLTNNFISGFFQQFMEGIPFHTMIQNTMSSMRDYKRYMQVRQEINYMRMKYSEDDLKNLDTDIGQKYKALNREMNESWINEFYLMGADKSMLGENLLSSNTRAMMNKQRKGKILYEAFLAEGTYAGEFVRDLHNMSDIVHRLSVYKYYKSLPKEELRAKGLLNSNDEIDEVLLSKRIEEMYVNYNKILPRGLDALRSYGIVPFASFFYYGSPYLLKQMKDRPLRASIGFATYIALANAFEDERRKMSRNEKNLEYIGGLRTMSMIPHMWFLDPFSPFTNLAGNFDDVKLSNPLLPSYFNKAYQVGTGQKNPVNLFGLTTKD